MAAVAQIQTVNITVNGVDLAVPKGELLIEAVKRLGIEIPIFCYHARLKPVGMCRMCLVETGTKQPDGTVRMAPKPQAACTLPCTDGLVVLTDSESIHRDRRGVLEFLLINHPLDCPICDRGGECPLQNNTLFYGPSTSRFVELKRHAPKAFPLSDYVTLDLERCIQCGRCVRFTEEISGDSQLAFRFRGVDMQPSTFEMTEFNSKFSGNTIEICPVGALTSSRYRFRARPWDLQTRPAICTLCSNGCNVWFDYRLDKMVRINGRTNEAVNEEWTCDKGKFGHDFYNSDKRLTQVFVRQGEGLVSSDWPEAFRLIQEGFSTGPVAALAGPMNSNEDLFMLKRVFAKHFGSADIDHRMQDFGVNPPDGQALASIESFEAAKSILVFGTSLSEELPILFLRVRKAWFIEGVPVVVAHSEPTDVDSFAHYVLRYKAGSGQDLLSALAGRMPFEKAAESTGVPAEQLQKATDLLQEARVIATRSGLTSAAVAQALELFGDRANVYALGANDQGAAELGLLPRGGSKGTREILTACAEGQIKALWLMGVDPIENFADKELARRALEAVDFLVYQGIALGEAANYASVLLPQTAPAETDGTYTNLERRVQRLERVLPAKGMAKPGWKALQEVALRLQGGAPIFNAGEVMDAIVAEHPEFAPARYDRLPIEGYILGAEPNEEPEGLDRVPPPEANG